VDIRTAIVVGGVAVALIVILAAWLWSRRVAGEAAALVESTTASLHRQIEAAREDRRRRDAILSAMTDGLVVVDDGAVAYANPAARQLLGSVPDTSARFTPARLRQLVDEAAGTRRPHEADVQTGATGVRLRASAVPLPEDDRVLLVLRDVTESRRIESMRRDFVANASHELKTPTAAIQAGAETLRQAVADDPAAADRFAEQLEWDAIRLSRLVSDLLDLSRLESQETAPAEPVRLDRVAEEEVARVRGRADESGIGLGVRTAATAVTGSAKDLALVVHNLLDNAVRYTPRGGRVDVDVDATDGEAVLTVRDTGVGIPRRDLPRIFERFYRVDAARSRATGGTGLGLSIARHVAEQHGGRIEAESELGRGTTFTVRIPLVSA
jgi:signal transduction histidine kinase